MIVYDKPMPPNQGGDVVTGVTDTGESFEVNNSDVTVHFNSFFSKVKLNRISNYVVSAVSCEGTTLIITVMQSKIPYDWDQWISLPE